MQVTICTVDVVTVYMFVCVHAATSADLSLPVIITENNAQSHANGL